jgi:hypothetical protein
MNNLMLLQNFFKDQADTVIHTNINLGKFPQNLEDWSTEDLQKASLNQLKRVLSEYEELRVSDSFKEHADGLCDVFVTAVGFAYLNGVLPENYVALDSEGIEHQLPKVTKSDISVMLSFSPLPIVIMIRDVVKSIISMIEYDCIGMLKHVNDNNLSKFPADKAVLEESVEWHKVNKPDETELVIKPMLDGSGFWLCRVRDSKYMKPFPYYNDVDHARFKRDI